MAFSVSTDLSWFLRAPVLVGTNPTPSDRVSTAINITVFPQWYKQVSLEWSVPKEWGACTYHVYFWPGQGAGYERLTTSPLDSPFFKDPTTREYSKFHNGYYVVEALVQNPAQSISSPPTTWQVKRRNSIELKASEIQRREFLLLSKFVGVKSFLFRKKTYGLRCPRCWSPTTEKVTDDHCPVCYGTSFEGGYFDPIPVFVQYDPTPNERTKTYYGDLEANQIGGWTIPIPQMSPEDVLVRSGDWNVYKVVRIASTELLANPVRQMVTLTQLSKTDIENSLMQRTQEPAAEKYLLSLGGRFSETRFPQKDLDQVSTNNSTWSPGDQPLPVKYTV